MKVTLLLQPAIDRSRSMLLYAERLVANAPDGVRLATRRLPAVGGFLGSRVPDLLAPPLVCPRIEEGLVHVVDHAHAGYVRFLRVPGIVTVHDLIPLKAMRGLYPSGSESERAVSVRSGPWFRWNAAALPAAARLVAPSRATARDVRRLIGDRPAIDVVPHGVDPEFSEAPGPEAEQRVTRRLGLLADRPILLQLTNGFFYKNDPGFSRAFERLHTRHPELAWVRVGAPPAPGQSGPDGSFLYYDRAGLGELVALYRRAAALLFPSWDEGFGWPPLEAMAAGCPVVASDRGALAETAAPAALVVDPADPGAMADAVTSILDDAQLRDELRARGRAHAGTYTWAAAARQMADVYRRVYFS